MKCYHGDVLSVNAANDTFHWLVEDEGKIVFVGNDLPERFQNAQRVELGEKALCPSFVDTHQHLASFSTFHAGLNVMDAASNREISDLIRDFVRRSSAKTLIAFGASPYSVAEGRLISRAELDAVCPDREMMVVKYDGHACIVNTPLLRKLEAKLSPLRGYHPDTGEMNQEAFFKVSDYITGSLSMIDLVKNLQNAVDFEASRGIGMVHTVSGVGFVANLDITMEQLFARSLKNGFQIRVFPQSLDVRAAVRRKLPRIGGCFARALTTATVSSMPACLPRPACESAAITGSSFRSRAPSSTGSRSRTNIWSRSSARTALRPSIRCAPSGIWGSASPRAPTPPVPPRTRSTGSIRPSTTPIPPRP